ncbi:MAG: N-acetylmuramoyl-L-alanine amidase [Actinomycetaceae bacterium]|nr:N-acetylmuramoyl-L-alanine amidase [Actinomycetaceae bacterium]
MNIRRLAVFSAAAALALSGLALPVEAQDADNPDAAGQASDAGDGGTQTLTITDDSGQLTDAAEQAELTEPSDADARQQLDAGGGQDANADGQAADLHPGYIYLSEPLAADTFGVAGLTWDAGHELPAGATVEMRTLNGTSWSDWYVLNTEDEMDEGEGRPGTEANVSGGSTGVQLRIRGEGQLPPGVKVHLVDGQGVESELTPAAASREPTSGSETADVVNGDEERSILGGEAAGVQSTSEYGGPYQENPELQAKENERIPTALNSAQRNAADSLAKIQPRSAWGADESRMTWRPSYTTFQGVIVHHTAGSNNYTQAQVPGVIRGIYSFHAVTRGWGDVGYNVLIDKYGGRWEGRSGTLASPDTQMVTGAHAAPRNAGTMGISVLGTFDNSNRPTNTILNAITDVAGWRFAISGVNPSSQGTMTVPSGTGAALTPGSVLPRIVGHKDVASTACPGSIYGYLDLIRTGVATNYFVLLYSNTTPQQPQQAQSSYYLSNTWSSTASISFTYGLASDEALVGDWDGDGKDTVGLRRGNSFALNNATSPRGNPNFSYVYGTSSDQFLVGDWDGDGRDTLAVRRGNVFHIRNSMGQGKADSVFTYGNAGDTVLVGDWDGDGKDTLAVRRGSQYHIRNSHTTGRADSVITYGRDGDDVYVGSFGGLRRDSLAVRRGNVYHILYTIRGGDADRVVTFGRSSDVTLVGDWDGNGVDTLGVRRG